MTTTTNIHEKANQLRLKYPKQAIRIVGDEVWRYSIRRQKYGPRDGADGSMTRSRIVHVLEAKH